MLFRSQNRPALTAIAEALIQRTGPRTGQIYFGSKGRDVELILKGLVLLGIDGSDMKLVVRRPADMGENPDFVVHATDLGNKIGVSTAVESLEWEKRKMKGPLLRLDVKDSSRDVGATDLHWEGRVRGLNHAAVWLRMVEE